LPVAPHCNIQCNYCNRLYDCVNESRPGVTSAIIEPEKAVRYLDLVLKEEPYISVVGIAGPGDPFCEPERTIETIERVHFSYPDLLLCLSSNGLNVSQYVDRIAELEVRHMTITVNTIDPGIGQKIYRWIKIDNRFYRGKEAAQILISKQLESIRCLKKRKITVKVNTIIIPGINENQVEEIARELSIIGADLMNIIPMFPVPGTPFWGLGSYSNAEINRFRDLAAMYIPQMRHCTRCRADAVGFLGSDKSLKFSKDLIKLQERNAYSTYQKHDKKRIEMDTEREQIASAVGI